ncbi:MAG: FAD-dependent oxidoreductase [Campylobacterota bacterium]|nr:FAD-dependent oxidoreductase [Campylobacterota bacterium]
MNNQTTDILVIGGGPAAMVLATTALENYPDKKITVIKKEKVGQVPCGIPYIFGKTLGDSDKNAMVCGGAVAEKINILVDTVNRVDFSSKTIYSNDNTIVYDKLVFATGSVPFVHKNFEHTLSYENIFTISKYKEDIDRIKNYIEDKKHIIIIGTGFIGVEMADELRSVGKEVTIVGGGHNILTNSFDEDLATKAEDIMKDLGINLALGQHASNVIEENNKATAIELCDGTVIKGDAVILCTGYKPNTILAEESGLSDTKYGGIWVDEYMKTTQKDVFAIGDCSGRRDSITRNPSKVMLASTSAAEARVAANSLYGIKYLKGFSGTIAIFSTMIGDRVFASAGVTQSQAEKENIDYVVGSFESMNRHPGTIPDASKQSLKLIALRSSGQIIGGQVVGDKEAGEIINIIGLTIEAKLTAHHLVSLQVATQPVLTPAPTTYPLIKAAQNILLTKNR